MTLLLCLLLFAAGSDDQLRIERLEKSLLAPCCWSEPISVHRSEVALQMKGEVARMVHEGKTDREILDFYKARYGMRILIEPEGGRWWLMQVVPAVFLILGLAIVVLIIRRMVRPIPSSSPG